MNYILYIILFLFMNLILSCKRNNVKDNSGQGFTVVTINNYHDKTIPFSEFSTRIDTIELQTNPYFMGEILDFCMSNSLLYVIDMNGAAWIFKTSSGNLVKRIHRIGHGRGEYTSIQAVTSKDSLVYLLDGSSGLVLEHDFMLNYKRSFHLNFPAVDFIKVNNGFLFCNLATTSDMHRLIYTDNFGKIENSYIPSDLELDMLYAMKTFTADENGNAFFLEPFSNDIYRWTGKEPQLVFHTDYGKNGYSNSAKKSSEITKSGKAFNATFFVFKDYLINSFFQEDVRYYSLNKLDGSSHLQGLIDTTECIPFYPTGQYKDGLIGIYNVSDLGKWKPKKDSCDAALFIFHLK